MTQASQIAEDDTLSPVRALNSLTTAQGDQIVAGLSSLVAAWIITRHESCDGQLSLLITQADQDTAIIVDRDSTGISVSLMNGDQIHTGQHRYRTISDTVAAIKAMAASPTLEPQRHIA